ncbi:structural maintenance of chromosomes flexible hinge domain-containing protein 1 isoform X1 [Ictalurus punctatus]|uniref:Structural maintenance of chromosomes flexible hinge domain-containing protein 1 isoform X1 n=1 Tax=Ictalurus punctatus TaxID=7998 RepID=A0A2D0RBC4_ICTPU|nr:structural maintenance of chromosomes flexible hinge domain-containing protein 1 isoform X1 [Ictalurus punctatus]XP_047012616.1 structural maintenance of chromosomes flexible hinge domain-containing protein 1 isoform X1 [Ictalurus punctatus]
MAESGVPAAETSQVSRSVLVFDCRPENKEASGKMLDIGGTSYKQFLCAVRKEFSISVNESFVITTTDRREIDSDVYEELSDGKTLHLLKSLDQELVVATEERINYVPHFHTIVQSGQYEYYASEGQKALPYAFAELIDNALSATAHNPETRSIDIRLFFDESQGGPAVVVMDNGRGMTSKELNNWAVYRLSKFNRDDRTFRSDKSGYVRPSAVPRSLNSDISYFGVGGKQAVFYIGQSVRIISKPGGSPDVHEFVMSKEDFEQKEKNNKEIYCGIIRNRKPADDSHVIVDEERFLQSLVLEEKGKDSFTAIVITAVQPEHVAYLKKDFDSWTRELAHIYHYYIHGIYGNDMSDNRTPVTTSNIDIQICLIERSPRLPRLLNLKEIDNDMQTLYINSSVAEFEFKASRGGDAKVEGLLRYHPFLYDRETYPEDPCAVKPALESDEDCFVLHAEGRGKRPIFECFWNGRLIPYSSVDEFEWCERPKKVSSVPLECYNRISGVLFTNDHFKVSTNKLTFMDLELQLRDKETIFTRVLNGQEQRVQIKREFANWLKECHERHDKQVKFLGFQGVMTRPDIQPKRLQSPWARYKAIVWDGKTYKSGQKVKTMKTSPIVYGTVSQFLLYGDHEGDVYATGGHVQIVVEPKEVYNEVKIMPITKIDRQASNADIKENIEKELDKLPDKLRVTWPKKNPWSEKDVRPAGTPMGPIKVEILNKKGETMSRWPVSSGNSRKFMIDLKVVWHSPDKAITTNSHIGVHSKWEYWFRPMENLNKLGTYTLHLQTILSDGDSPMTEWAGTQLPHYTLNFSIKEGSAAAFVTGVVPSPVQVGVPFPLPLQFTDEFNHPTLPPSGIKPQLECSSLTLSYEQTTSKDSTFTIQDLKAMGKLTDHQVKIHTVKVMIPGLNPESQTFQISVRPGPPHHLVVKPTDEVCIENGTSAGFRVEVQDEFHNVTTHSSLIVRCQLFGASDLPADTVDCSNTGSGLLLAKPIQLKNVTTERILTAKFGIPNLKAVACVERRIRILPSTRVFRIEVYRQEDDSDDVMVLQNKECINWTAGDTLGSLRFKLYDEGGRQVALTQRLAHNIKVNWTADLKAAELAKGRLPCVCVPTKTNGEQFYQVAFQDQHTVDTSFTIIPRPDEPDRLKVTLSETTVRMSETLSANIYVEVIDQYGNKTDALNAESMKAVSVSADNLDESALKFDWQTSTGTMVVTGVRFAEGFPGPRQLCFKYQNFNGFVSVNVTAGPPTKITLLEAPELPLCVLNGHGIATPFVLQLCDEWGNPVPDQRVVIAIKTLSPQLKVKSSVMSQPVNAEGKASFILETITATIGDHELEFRGSFSRNKTISGPVVKLSVMPDPNNPVKLCVEYDSEAILRAGDLFPVFKVTILSEEGGPVKNVSPSSLSMLLWQGLASGSRPPPTAVALKCSKPKDKENDDHFYFRDKEIPSRVGKYMLQFLFAVENGKSLWSSQIALDIVANKPVKLVPDTPASTPVVSNSSTLANRTLLQFLCLKIMDKHNNPAGMGINGKVILTVTTVDGDDAEGLPMFENKAKSLTYNLLNGETRITVLALMENSPGADGAVYTLQFRPVLEGPKSNPTIPPFNLPFRFYNDAENQKAMAAMSKKKDQLSQSIEVYKAILETNKQLTTELKGQVQDAVSKEAQLKSELKNSGIDISKLTDVESVENLIDQMTAHLVALQNLPRRKCTMPDPFRGSHDVLGKIAHLALVKDDDAAKVISWHILGDMDCVVTVTTAAAKKIYDDTKGRQQVMPLETIFWKPNNRPLPHIKNGQSLFPPLGNPVFARDLLFFPDHAESCNMVFTNVLGDTILVDDLDSANHYRKRVVQSKMQCPTLLTRQGDRIRSNGKFGGLQNKAPPIEKLRGHVFGAPLPHEYHTICKQKELLQQYSVAVQKALKVKDDYDNHVQSPQMKQKQQELQQQEKELRDIEKMLTSTPVRTSPGSIKRKLQHDVDESLPAKRIRRKTRKLLDP